MTTPREALARIADLAAHDPADRGGDTFDADEVRAILADVGDQGGASFTSRATIPADQPLLALWVHVDLDGHATFGGRMTPADTASTLRFIADGLDRGEITLGATS